MTRWLVLLCACGGSAATEPDASVSIDAADPRSAGCGQPTMLVPGQTIARTLRHGERDRTYRIRLPAGYTGEPVPLVFALHGGFGSGEQIETNQAGFNPIAEREGFAMVYPDGVPRDPDAQGPIAQARTWNGGGCCGFAMTQNVDDVGFLTAVLDELEAGACIDRSRVFITGMSNGGIMSYRMACERADRITAIAPVAGTMLLPSCTPARPVPVFAVHGSADENVPYLGGTGCGVAMLTTPPIADIVATWAGLNGCTGAPATVLQQGNGTCTSSGACAADTVLCTIDGGSHSWPGGGGGDGDCGTGAVSTTFFASEAIWSFFAPLRR